jgi:hypothetical protein
LIADVVVNNELLIINTVRIVVVNNELLIINTVRIVVCHFNNWYNQLLH